MQCLHGIEWSMPLPSGVYLPRRHAKGKEHFSQPPTYTADSGFLQTNRLKNNVMGCKCDLASYFLPSLFRLISTGLLF